jgi:hypothetical protein
VREERIVYFEKPGRENTAAVAECVARRLGKGGIEHVVVASNSGATALALLETVGSPGVKLVSVTQHSGFDGGDEVRLKEKFASRLREAGVPILMCSHALSGVGRSISDKFGGATPVEVIAHTLRRLGQGVKVCVEIAVMAADAGLVPTDRDIVAVGGSGGGADTAVVMKAAHMNTFFDVKIREILCKPADF